MKDYLEKKVETARKQEVFEEEIKLWLRNDERIQAYFKQFDTVSVEGFIEKYAEDKARWYHHVENYWHLKEKKLSKSYQAAQKALNLIAQKKVFDQMCSWLKGEVAFDCIEVAPEWDYWLRNPMYFPSAEPISQAEVDAHIAYIEQLPEDKDYWTYIPLFWLTPIKADQEAPDEIDEIDDLDDYGDWFRYYDKMFHGAAMEKFSSERVVKEDYYEGLKDNSEKEKNPVPPEAPTEPKPYLDYEAKLKLQERYVAEFETYENKMAYEGYCWFLSTDEFTERVASTVFTLQELEEYVPLTPNDDWREGLKNALQMFERGKLVDALPVVYEEYLILLGNNLGFEDWFPREGGENKDKNWILNYKANILEGRKLLNEPEDFNF